MRVFTYYRVDDFFEDSNLYKSFLINIGVELPVNRMIVEEVKSDISLRHRSKFIKLINHSMKGGDVLLISGLDSLGCNFIEVYSSVSFIFNKKIRLICLDFSKNEIDGDIKKLFLHFLKLSSNFEEKVSLSRKIIIRKAIRKVGRPEKLTKKQQSEALLMFKKGHTIYAISKHFSVTRTVINRLIEKSIVAINFDNN